MSVVSNFIDHERLLSPRFIALQRDAFEIISQTTRPKVVVKRQVIYTGLDIEFTAKIRSKGRKFIHNDVKSSGNDKRLSSLSLSLSLSLSFSLSPAITVH